MTDPRTEAALAALYTFEHDFPNVIPFEEAARIMRNADAPHKGDCALAEKVYAATCMRCQRDSAEARARAALAAADAASVAGAGETLDGLICTGPDEHGTVRVFHAGWKRAAAALDAQARQLSAARASIAEFLPIMQRHLDQILEVAPADQREAMFKSKAYMAALARVERARAALGKEPPDAG